MERTRIPGRLTAAAAVAAHREVQHVLEELHGRLERDKQRDLSQSLNESL